MGAEPSRLVKRLPDDRKIRGILLLTGCCVSAFFSPPSFIFFFFYCSKCFLSVCFQSSCLRRHNKCRRSVRAATHAEEKGAATRTLPQETDLILCSQIGGNRGGGKKERKRSRSLTKTSSPPLIIQTGFDCLFGNSFSNRCNDND